MKKLVIASRNKGKIREITAIFSRPDIKFLCLDDFPDIPDIVENGSTFEENAFIKAQTVALATCLPALADDSGLEVDSLGGAPGIYSARFAGEGAGDEENNRRLLEELKAIGDHKRTARFRCVVVLYHPSGAWMTGEGVCEGVIAETLRGANGFGYDPLFIPYGGGNRTMAEIADKEKNALSHRAKALRDLIKKLNDVPQFIGTTPPS
ncbi:MAG: XTP/dITP diphosphatase [Dissulfurimicrobium sp.]|uniref:XTP/dITP diphosphatase n=1 Tax=Dissulfurimicrobium TaxID=1769732 RepID=UPI001EDBCF69|nr:XTP/dITP diphosphatase [Dissulfurimicrobium hydrothermale]UKL13189.1 XTP/dITP diphosphatase [Dissulfurimicrobium hydrothermale]